MLQAILGWLKQNSDLVASVSGIATVFIWVAYAQLFFFQYLQQRRPRLFLHVAPGRGLDSTCLLINMSEQIVHVQCVMAVARCDGKRLVRQVTDYRTISQKRESESQMEAAIKQGPLSPGKFIDLGTFEEIIDATVPSGALHGGLDMLELRVVAAFGVQKRPVGAKRRFAIERTGNGVFAVPETSWTEQLTSRSGRRSAESWLEECMNPATTEPPREGQDR